MIYPRDKLERFLLAFWETILRAVDRWASRGAETVAIAGITSDSSSHEMARGDLPVAQSAGNGTGEDPPEPDSAPGGAEHDVRGRTGGPADAGGGTRPPDSATRHVETTLGRLSYSELAPHLARAVLALQDDIQAGRYAGRGLDEDLILHFHAQIAGALIPRIGGRWRALDVRVGSHVPPPPHQVPVLMREYARDLQARLAALPALPDERLFELLAFAEWRLLWIHPFEDFNGRVARVVLVELMRRLDLPAVDTVPAPGHETRSYLDALRAADRHDLALLAALWRERFERESLP